MALEYSKAPIARINTDILSMIFWAVAGDSPVDYTRRPIVQTSWIRLGQVCALWRTVLMDMPALWSTVLLDFGTRRAFKNILTRTRDAPLQLRSTRRMKQDAADRIAKIIPRVVSLECYVYADIEEQFLRDAVLHRRLPSLRTLILRTWGDTFREFQEMGNTRSLADLGALSRLELHGVYFRPPLSGSLVLLCIDGFRLPLPLHEALHVLSHNPALQDVKLGRTCSVINDKAAKPRTVMPVLVSLGAHFDSTDVLHSFLGALHMPALQELDHVRVGAETHLTPDSVYTILKSVLPVHRTAFAVPPISRLALYLQFTTFFLHAFLDVAFEEPRQKRKLRILLLPESRPFDISYIAGVAQCFLDTRVADEVRELACILDYKEAENRDAFRILLSCFKNVEDLVCDVGQRHFERAMLPALAQTDLDEGLFLPNLRSISISQRHSIPRPEAFKETIRRRVERGGAAFEVWLFTKTEEWSSDTAHELQKRAGMASLELSDVSYSNGRLEGRLRIDGE